MQNNYTSTSSDCYENLTSIATEENTNKMWSAAVKLRDHNEPDLEAYNGRWNITRESFHVSSHPSPA
jgi:hypothetical protein